MRDLPETSFCTPCSQTFGMRGARCKLPLLTLTVTVTLALGLGANAAIFNLIDRMVFRPYPLIDPDRAVLLSETGPRLFTTASVSTANLLDTPAHAAPRRLRKEPVSFANGLDWGASSGALPRVSAFQWWDANLVDREDPER